MIEVLGWVLLLVVTLYITYVFVLAIAMAWTNSYKPPMRSPSEPPFRSVPTTQCIVCGVLGYDGERCACGPIFGCDMGAGDDITTYSLPPRDSLDAIIRDLNAAIDGEHLEVRATNRFATIRNRLEDYRARPSA